MGNKLAKNTYHTKQISCLLGLQVEKIYACRNDYMLFRNGDAYLEVCCVCGALRYKHNIDDINSDDVGEKMKDKRPSAKMV